MKYSTVYIHYKINSLFFIQVLPIPLLRFGLRASQNLFYCLAVSTWGQSPLKPLPLDPLIHLNYQVQVASPHLRRSSRVGDPPMIIWMRTRLCSLHQRCSDSSVTWL